MMDLHLLENGGTNISDDNLTIWGDEHLVQTLWTEGGLEEGGNCSSSQDVDLIIVSMTIEYLPCELRVP